MSNIQAKEIGTLEFHRLDNGSIEHHWYGPPESHISNFFLPIMRDHPEDFGIIWVDKDKTTFSTGDFLVEVGAKSELENYSWIYYRGHASSLSRIKVSVFTKIADWRYRILGAIKILRGEI